MGFSITWHQEIVCGPMSLMNNHTGLEQAAVAVGQEQARQIESDASSH
ncbi:hypothetical protein BH18ACI4_BH18ACI4_14850 [soil metagenome]